MSQQNKQEQIYIQNLNHEQQAAEIDEQILNEINTQDLFSQKILSNTEYQYQQQEYEQRMISLKQTRFNISIYGQSSLTIDDTMQKYMKIQQIKQILQIIGKALNMIEDGTNLIKSNEKYVQFYKIYNKTLQASKKINKLRLIQIKSFTYLFQHLKNISLKDYEKTWGKQFNQFCIPYPKINNGKPNINMALKVLQVELPLLNQQQKILINISEIISSRKYIQNINIFIKQQQKMKIINSKLLTISQIFPYSCTVPFDDLMCLSIDHQRRKFVNKYTKIIKFRQRQDVKNSFNKIKQSMNVVNSIIGLTQDTQKKEKNKNIEILKCLVSKDTAHHYSAHMMAQPSFQLPRMIWNLTDQKYLKPLIKLGNLPGIEFLQKIYIPRIMKKVFESRGKESLPKQLYIQDKKQYYEKVKIKKDYKDAILLRINSPFALKPRFETKQNEAPPKGSDKLIIHIHGGGFIGFSTFVHQAYIRNWAKNIGVPIISVQYGKAPQYPFPFAIEDCLQAVMWAVYCFGQTYNVNPTKIVLVGDSSGGNLAAVLNNILLQWDLYKLSGVVCIYPALNLNFKSFTPSLLSSLNDMILPHTFLKLCLKCYLKEPNLKPDQDPLISPLLVSNQIIKKYPPYQIFIGDVDAFHDDALKFTQKINDVCPGKCNLTIFQEFPHGFIMFDLKLQSHQDCGKANKIVQQAITKLLFI